MTATVLDCVHCGLCLQACPTYDVLGLETDSPRGRIHLMRAWDEGRIEDIETIRPHLDRCLGCRACETACPSGVSYGEILETSRSKMGSTRWRRFLLSRVLSRPRRLRALVSVLCGAELLGLRRLAEWLRLVPASTRDLVPRIPPARERKPLAGTYEPEGPLRGTVMLFTGCVMSQLFGDVNRRTLELLQKNGYRVAVPPDQVCCGALLVHDGQVHEARRLARQNIRAFAGGHPVLHNSAGCGAAMKEYGRLVEGEEASSLAGRAKDVLEFLASEGLSHTPAPRAARVAYDDPCHLCHGQGVRRAPRELLARVPDLVLVDHDDPETCCGSAGIYNLTQPALAAEIGMAKVKRLLAAAPDLVTTGNPGCIMQIRAHLRRVGSNIPVLHPVELLL
jgi:glycolate dehydrogenase iron-sulfur subunit